MAYQGGCDSLDASEVEPVGKTSSRSLSSGGGGEMAEKEEEQPSRVRHPADTDPLCRISKLINWKKPLWTSSFFATTNIAFWFVSLSPCRVFSLLSICVALLVMIQLMGDVALSRSRGAALWRSMTSRLGAMASKMTQPFVHFLTILIGRILEGANREANHITGY